MDPLERQSAKLVEQVSAIERTDAGTNQALLDIRGDIAELKGDLNKLMWAIVGLAFTVATSAIGLAVQQALSGGNTP